MSDTLDLTAAYYESKHWKNNVYWKDVPMLKCPMDIWAIQDIIATCKPNVIIETGTYMGASAKFMYDMMQVHNISGKVITIDMHTNPVFKDDSIIMIQGNSTSEDTVTQVEQEIAPDDNVMVVLDSNHFKEHVLRELQVYSRLVTPGQYLIVEDTSLTDKLAWGDGTIRAVEEFVKSSVDFIVDDMDKKLLLTFNASGYLKKIGG